MFIVRGGEGGGGGEAGRERVRGERGPGRRLAESGYTGSRSSSSTSRSVTGKYAKIEIVPSKDSYQGEVKEV